MKLGRAVTFFLRLSVLLTVSMHAKEQNPSDTRQAIWNIRIDRLLKEPPGWAPVDQHETQALAFSPDRQRLALTLAHQGRS